MNWIITTQSPLPALPRSRQEHTGDDTSTLAMTNRQLAFLQLDLLAAPCMCRGQSSDQL